MQLVINTLGTQIMKKSECFLLKSDDKKQEISAKKINQIILTAGANISTDAMELALENDIDILLIDKQGNPKGRLHNNKMGSIATIRKNQLKLEEHTLGTILIKEIISQKIKNQAKYLEELSETRNEENKKIIESALESINKQILNVESIDNDSIIPNIRQTIQGYEGTASRVYFSTLSKLIPKKYKFEGRSQRPAKDEFNCMLNYGYGIMYSNVEKACVLTGLDPYIGILHTDNYNKKTFVFDLIEMYRVYIDKIVFNLFASNKVESDFFDINEEQFYLNNVGKRMLINNYMNMIKERIRYKGRNIELENIIKYDCQNIANRILKEI